MSLFEKYKAMREEIDLQSAVDEELLPVTVRLPKSLIAKVDFIKDQLKDLPHMSRQSVMLDIIHDAVDEAFQGCLVGAGYSGDDYSEVMAKVHGYSKNEDQQELDV